MADINKVEYGHVDHYFWHVKVKKQFLKTFKEEITEKSDILLAEKVIEEFVEIEQEYAELEPVVNMPPCHEDVIYLIDRLAYNNLIMESIIERCEHIHYIRSIHYLEQKFNDVENDLKRLMKNQVYLDYFNLVRETADRGDLSFVDIKSKDVPSEIEEIVKAFFACHSCYQHMRLFFKDDKEFVIVFEDLEKVSELIKKVDKSSLKLVKS